MASIAAKRIVLVRHAECDMNLTLATKVGGQANESPLTAKGIKQAEALGKHLTVMVKSKGPFHVHSSTAVRTRHTATLMLQTAGLPSKDISISPEILEISMGDWEGQPRAECYTEEVQAAIASDPWNFAPPSGESQKQVEARVTAYIVGTVLPALTAGGPPGIVVSHGLAIKCFLRGILHSEPAMTWRMVTDNTSVTEVAYTEGAAQPWQVVKVNDTAHLMIEELCG